MTIFSKQVKVQSVAADSYDNAIHGLTVNSEASRAQWDIYQRTTILRHLDFNS
jgi:hypothetical protein